MFDGVTAIVARHRLFLVLFGSGLALRLALAYWIFPGQGFATDVQLFTSWANTLARVGPLHFYATAGRADYPPGYLYVLWVLAEIGRLDLVKLPAILADMATAVLLYRAARSWWGERRGLAAAGLYLFIPVTWYDSALWGQVDAVGTLLILAALLLLIARRSEWAIAFAVLAIVVKPQYAIALAVVMPVLLRRHLFTFEPRRLTLSALAGAAALVLPLMPFDIAVHAPGGLAQIPVLGQVAGLVGLFFADGARFSYLTANAYNIWALVGSNPLAVAIGSAGGSWTSDSLVVGGSSAVMIGALALVAVSAVVFGGLLLRDDRLAILLGLCVVAFAFYTLPTRVHERYLFPFFAPAALLAVGAAPQVLGYITAGLLNAVNLHAVLAAPLQIGGGQGFGGGFGRGPGGGFRGLGGDVGSAVASIRLPLAELARSEFVVTFVALAQTAAFVILLAVWLAVVVRPRVTWVAFRSAARLSWRS